MSAALVALFAPYCQGAVRGGVLEQALEWMALGELRGQRRLRPEGQRPFVLRWQAGVAPLEPTQLQLEIETADGAAVQYAVSLPTHQLVLWLMDWLEAGGSAQSEADLPESFWRWLLLGLDPSAASS